MFSRDTYFLVVSAFLQTLISMPNPSDGIIHQGIGLVMLLSLRYHSATSLRSLSRIRSKLVIVSTSIWLSKYHRVSARRPKLQELSSIRESLQHADVISLRSLLRLFAYDQYTMLTHFVCHFMYPLRAINIEQLSYFSFHLS